jgi:pyruvate kinase
MMQSPGSGRESAARLLDEIDALDTEIAAAAASRLSRWAARLEGADGTAREGAENLAAYLALRKADLSDLQERLSALGLSSLGRCEAHVGATLSAVRASLAAIAGRGGAAHPGPAVFGTPARRIAAARDALFGSGAAGAETRILATLPREAAADPDHVPALVAAGADCLRVNTAHDGPSEWDAMVRHLRAAEAASGRRVPLVVDLPGPKVRTREVFVEKGRRLGQGDRLTLRADAGDLRGGPWATLTEPDLIDRIAPGAPVWFDDGKLRCRAVHAGPGAVELEVVGCKPKGVRLKPEKGVAVPGLALAIPALCPEDGPRLDFVAREADVVGLSFVQSVADVDALVAALDQRAGPRPRPAILLKIETAQAVRNLPDLIVAARAAGPAAVMIARGDLAVDVGFERLTELQDELLWICEASHVPVVWATQVLDGLLHDGLATRAEATDAAMGQRAECVMLNKGPYQREAVVFLRSVLTRMERHQAKKFARLAQLRSW